MPRPSIGPKLFWASPNLFDPDQNVSDHNLNLLTEIDGEVLAIFDKLW